MAAPASLTLFLLVGLSFAALVQAHVVSDFSVVNVSENSNSKLTLLYKITGVWGNHEGSMLLWVLILTLFGVLVAAFGGNLPDRLKALVLSVQGWIGFAFLSLRPRHLESVPAHREPADRGPRPQPGAAGHWPRGASADALSRLCRVLDLVLLRGGRADRRPHRRGLGALGASVDAGGMDIPHARHRDGFVLGLLRARLGRLVVLGPGRECFPDALACRHRAAAFRGRDGKAQRAEGLDHPVVDPDLLIVAARHLPGALRAS